LCRITCGKAGGGAWSDSQYSSRIRTKGGVTKKRGEPKERTLLHLVCRKGFTEIGRISKTRGYGENAKGGGGGFPHGYDGKSTDTKEVARQDVDFRAGKRHEPQKSEMPHITELKQKNKAQKSTPLGPAKKSENHMSLAEK